MRDVSNYRVQLDFLRAQLVSLWTKTPLPLDQIAQVTKQLRNILREMGIDPHHQTGRPDRRGYHRAYNALYKSRKSAGLVGKPGGATIAGVSRVLGDDYDASKW